MTQNVIIIGAGLSGLSCARQLLVHRVPFTILEAADAVGGRVRTDQVEGFRLDRGFQVLLSSYPELQRWLDLDQLELQPFVSGASVRYQGRFYPLADPWRRPWAAVQSLLTPVGSLADKLRIARLRSLSLRGSYQERMQDPELTTLEYLKQLGFSAAMIDRFLRPFLGGIFLDNQLRTSSRMLNFVFRMFSVGDACLPAQGMQALPELLAQPIPTERIQLGASVERITPGQVTLTSGQQLSASQIVVAVDQPAARRLLPDLGEARGRSVHCVYYTAAQPPFQEPILVLNGDGQGPINNLCVPSNVARTYAPPGQSLISVTVLNDSAADTSMQGPAVPDQALEERVRVQLRDWYGSQVDRWRHLRSYTIPYALPDQAAPALSQPERAVRYSAGIYVCGDHRDNASIEGALVSGRRAADALLNDR